MKNFQSIIIFSFTLILTAISCNSPEEEAAAGEVTQNPEEIRISKKQFEIGEMQLGILSEQVLRRTVATRGYIDVPPSGRSAVSPYYGGYVKEINVLPGQQMKKGELLFTLQNPDYLKLQQEYLETKEQLIWLEADYERQKTLAEEKIASQKSSKKAESLYRVMLAKYSGLKERLQLMNVSIERLEKGQLTSIIPVYAPLSGSITKVMAVRSAFIDASEVALEIVNIEHIHLELQVYEKDVINVKEHQSIVFSVPESGSESFTGEVHLVSKSVDAEQRTVEVHGHIAEEDEGKFIPGMFVEAEIEISANPATCLPLDAVVAEEEREYVLVKVREEEDAYFFTQQEVKSLGKTREWVEIEAPEALSGKQVLVRGAFSLAGG
ncbi:MAG: efflux RND transporter periplasmic adaptor subunit [Cyclobacteriaceae bacterium]